MTSHKIGYISTLLASLVMLFASCARVAHAEDYFHYLGEPGILMGHKALHAGISFGWASTMALAQDPYGKRDDLLTFGLGMGPGFGKEVIDWSGGEPFWYGVGDLTLFDAPFVLAGIALTNIFFPR